MIGMRPGKVLQVIRKLEEITELVVEVDEKSYKAINYNRLTGTIEVGDEVLLNTTGVDLSLGTGGSHFVMANLSHPRQVLSAGGHIIKLRYSPYQLKVFAAEEQDSQYHHVFNEFQSLERMPVVVGTLHSMLPAIVEVLKHHQPHLKICYIMTDAAALPIHLSETVRQLKEMKKITATVTIGHAFGGDLECINIYNGLIAAKEIVKADIAVVTMGPGIVGTGTKFGFTGVEQGNIIDAVNDLEGIPFAVPRISFSDSRERHQGLSHHTLTVLSRICKTKAVLGIPYFDGEKNSLIERQLKSLGILERHHVRSIRCDEILHILQASSFNMKTMGRGLEEEKEFFLSAGLAAKLAIDSLTPPL